MIDEALAQFRAHRQNISRYRSLLQTNLTEFERRFIERRIAEEEAAVSALAFGDSQYVASKGSVELCAPRGVECTCIHDCCISKNR